MSCFAKEKNKLDVPYQQQVDDMFFYDYRCYMRKHGIIDDIPNIPLDEENETILGEKIVQGDNLVVENKSTTIGHDD